MFGWFTRGVTSQPAVPLRFHNTKGNTLEQFTASGKTVRMYNCGPTVYDFQHIGNLSAAVFADTLRRVLEYNGYAVKQVINITDFGHLTSDADEGEDKMAKALKREQMKPTMENMLALAERYTQAYLADVAMLGVSTAKIEFPRASAYIDAQIALIKTLDEKGYVYRTKDGLYFETSLFKEYGALGGIDIEHLEEGARVVANPEKHHPTDFALWKFSKDFGWDSPWGKGSPGWHIECSAMARSLLGEQIDIHTGGIEHVAIHHNNEIAQSEAATGKTPFSRFWMHRAHIQIDGHKIAKSEGNTVYLKDVLEHGMHPLALRYWFLTSHYRTPANFTWGALGAAAAAFTRLHRHAYEVRSASGRISPKWQKQFTARINADLDTAGAIAIVWDMLKDTSLSHGDLRATLLDFDRVLGLGLTAPDEKILSKIEDATLPAEDEALRKERDDARAAKDWARADALREELEKKGYAVRDTDAGTVIVRR
ncbi:MAG: cysteine--tRNA ligase [Parcubacteria group bacterium]|nr:cysteine--tRNA ligase [Parcubacteria group bacterium]